MKIFPTTVTIEHLRPNQFITVGMKADESDSESSSTISLDIEKPGLCLPKFSKSEEKGTTVPTSNLEPLVSKVVAATEVFKSNMPEEPISTTCECGHVIWHTPGEWRGLEKKLERHRKTKACQKWQHAQGVTPDRSQTQKTNNS
jgi:hypothetical protein